MIKRHWVWYDSEETKEAALALCRGCYQENLIRGQESWSGSTLKGKAGQYRSKYSRSAGALRKRLESAEITVTIETGEPGHRHILVLSRTSAK